MESGAQPSENLLQLAAAMKPLRMVDAAAVFRDPDGLQRVRDAVAPIATPETEFVMEGSQEALLTVTRHGIEGLIEGWSDFTAAFDHFWNEPHSFIERGDVILILTHQKATTATGGVALDNEGAGVFHFAEGRLTRAEFHLDAETAMRSAGIPAGTPATELPG